MQVEKVKMKKHKQNDGDWLSALTIMGRILIFVPMGASLLGFILSSNGGLEASPGDAYVMGMIFLCGVVTLVYVAVKRFRAGLRGDVEAEDSQK